MNSVGTSSSPTPNGLLAAEPILHLRQSTRLQQIYLLNLASDSQSDPIKSVEVDPSTSTGFFLANLMLDLNGTGTSKI